MNASLTDADLDDIGGFSGPLVNKSGSDAVFNDIGDASYESPRVADRTSSYTSLNGTEVRSQAS